MIIKATIFSSSYPLYKHMWRHKQSIGVDAWHFKASANLSVYFNRVLRKYFELAFMRASRYECTCLILITYLMIKIIKCNLSEFVGIACCNSRWWNIWTLVVIYQGIDYAIFFPQKPFILNYIISNIFVSSLGWFLKCHESVVCFSLDFLGSIKFHTFDVHVFIHALKIQTFPNSVIADHWLVFVGIWRHRKTDQKH